MFDSEAYAVTKMSKRASPIDADLVDLRLPLYRTVDESGLLLSPRRDGALRDGDGRVGYEGGGCRVRVEAGGTPGIDQRGEA